MDMNFPHAEIGQQQVEGQPVFRAALADVLSGQLSSPTGKLVRSYYNRPASKALSAEDRMKRRIRFFAGQTNSPPSGAFMLNVNKFDENGVYHSASVNGKIDNLAMVSGTKQQQARNF